MMENVGDVFSIVKFSDVFIFIVIFKVLFILCGFCGVLDVKVDVDYQKIFLINCYYLYFEILKSNF